MSDIMKSCVCMSDIMKTCVHIIILWNLVYVWYYETLCTSLMKPCVCLILWNLVYVGYYRETRARSGDSGGMLLWSRVHGEVGRWWVWSSVKGTMDIQGQDCGHQDSNRVWWKRGKPMSSDSCIVTLLVVAKMHWQFLVELTGRHLPTAAWVSQWNTMRYKA